MTPSGLAALAVAFAMPAPVFGFIGFGISMYDPPCAFACRSSIAGLLLECSVMDHAGGGHVHGMDPTTPPDCRSGDTSFLTTLANCVSENCAEFDVTAYKLERYWHDQASGDKTVYPKWSYAETLVKVAEDPPTIEITDETTLNFTGLVSADTWEGYLNTHKRFELAETRHSAYGLVLLVVGFGAPILTTLLGKLPFMTKVSDKLKPYIIYPSAVGTYQVRPLPYLLGNAPTVGHTIYIVAFFGLSVIFTAVGYETGQPNMWFADTWEEVMGYLSARTGVLAFALAPLVILFSGRNNFLLWVTNWSHSTFMLLHRWMARIFALQVVLHSITELVLYLHWDGAAEQEEPYWIWGIVATLAVCIMLVVSTLWLRRMSYEVFLIVHIVLAAITLIGSWYHVELLFTKKWGYELWLYTCFAVWAFDRIMRIMRIAKAGLLTSSARQIGDDVIRVDIEGVRWSAEPGWNAYAYFPGLSPMRPWENHPFSVTPTALLRRAAAAAGETSSPSSSVLGAATSNAEKGQSSPAVVSVSGGQASTTAGITLFIRKGKGLTKLFAPRDKITTLLDGPYVSSSAGPVLKCDRLLLIAGGVGITGILAFLPQHTNVKLCWSVRESSADLVTELEGVVSRAAEKDVRVGSRLDISALLAAEEEAGWFKVGVVVCGPGGLCDHVRAEVVRRGRKGPVTWELEVDAFSW